MPRLPEVRDRELMLAWAFVAVALLLASVCAIYAARHFSVTTDVKQLFPRNLGWTERDKQFAATFPQYQILTVVDAPTQEYAEQSSGALASALRAEPRFIEDVEDPQDDAFLKRNALLFLPASQLERATRGLQRSGPLIGVLARDPSLVGALDVLVRSLAGVRQGAYKPDALALPMSEAADTVSAVLDGRPASFSWLALAGGRLPSKQRRFIEIAPMLDFTALEPAAAATDTVMNDARGLDLARTYQARVQVTGLAPMNDAQFSTLEDNALLNAIISTAAVLIILWLALRSWRIIVPALISVVCGLSYSAALGLYLVGSLNLISVAFFVLFVGLAVDFGIQFSVRYRAERHDTHDLKSALFSAGRKAGWPLGLAGAATAVGFSAFLPTNYRGLSELGEIAGPGMIIAFATSMTLLPALLRILRPPEEPEAMGFSRLATVDRFLQENRIPVLVATLAVVLLATPLLAYLRFDFNTLHLQDLRSPAVFAFLQIRKDKASGANAIEITAPNLDAARADARKLAALPEVAETRTLANLVPDQQAAKLALIGRLRSALGPYLASPRRPPVHSDAEIVKHLQSTARALSFMAGQPGPGGEAASRLSELLTRLSSADPALRERADAAIAEPLEVALRDLRQALRAEPIMIDSVPPDLSRQWLAPDGRARVQVLPNGDPDNTEALRNFVRTVLKHEPGATGPAVTLYEAGNTVVRAFIEAGLVALGAIALLLWIALRRVGDVLMTLVPLLLAALLTLELCVVLGIQLNFTNIIAFPLLLGVGVAFKIYYIMAWRRGRSALVQSTLTRAVFFSALTTATAFGSLWLSHHPGTSSMGELMMLSLICTMMAAVFFQPVLMGPPRDVPEAPHAAAGRPALADR